MTSSNKEQQAPHQPHKTTSTAQRLVFAACAGIGATLVVHPLDVTRFHMQLDGQGGTAREFTSAFGCVKHIFKTQGLLSGLYAGISAGIFRQISYGTPRLAIYPVLLERFNNTEGQVLPFWKKLLLGSLAGGIAALAGVPSEVCLVRMGADSKKPLAERRNYKHVGDALVRIARDEGVSSLWGGTGPTVARACLLNAGQLGVYSQAKEALQDYMSGIPLQFCASLVAAVAAVGMSCPADVVKTRLQNQVPGQYAGVADCVTVLLKQEGILALWKGFGPATVKVAPHSVISFIILDNLTHWYTGKSAM
jgi:solute carrier family 25 oxoglutarate transporter 11